MIDGTITVARDSARDIDVPLSPLKQISWSPSASVTLRYVGTDSDAERVLAVTSGTVYYFPIRKILSTTSAAVILTFNYGSPFEG